GTIGARGNNGIGVAGVNWNVKILPLKIGGSTTSVNGADGVLAVNYIRAMRERGVNVRVVNHSWGGFNFSQMMQDAFNAAANVGIMQVCAAGNQGQSGQFYPAAYSGTNVISVGSTNRFEFKSGTSNFSTSWVDLGAPGEEIISTVMGNGYEPLTGTSMAAPHVTGAIALALSLNPTASITQIRNALLTTVDVSSNYSTYWATSGRLNVDKFLKAMLPIPNVPTSPDLISISDSGQSSTDNITSDSTPTFTGTGSPGSTIHLLNGANEVAMATVDIAGNWSATTSTLSEGAHSITAYASTQAGSSTASSALNVTIDTTKPTFSFVFSVSPKQSLAITLSEAPLVGTLDENDFVLVRLSDESEVANNIKSLHVDDSTHLRLEFTSILPDGQYELRLASSLVSDLASNGNVALTINSSNTPGSKLFVLAGDLDHNGTVDFSDLLIVAQHYGQSGHTFAAGNVDYSVDTLVSFSDLLIVAQHYGTSALLVSNRQSNPSESVSGSV
ncbi:MAG TPA: S8 family serine peptidase, partial [Tepidisphaeraceae bacterium]|nr:S8 family serine peptidase [Tepidisphaeraceae bacterium]